MDTALLVEQFSVWRGRSEIVRSIDLTIPGGSLVALVGSNGAGKTTFIEGVLGILPTRATRFELFGEDVRGRKPWDLVNGGLVVVPQERRLFPAMTVEENLDIVQTKGAKAGGARFSRDELYDLFPRLQERATNFAGTLSGGERSMLAIARGLALQPRLLILDEPSLGLAPVVIDSIMATIREISATGLSILLVEQNVHQALSMSSWAHVLDAGAVIASESSDDLRDSPLLESGYLGAVPTGEEKGVG
ncbi:ABC transporter ATP-binding protein [Aeromicrobium choanae]|uniref:Branched-chain amino acid transport system ATP-binding protein n=1 Tax=Aeromicrobium choanae TaxID=1736691 RepID=A0A1T4Z779_9ACTN|nr:ABC transporter ATP-binding protein [Aeromicrobium choanae]SKB09435.1 branched-chain amino acid transport system ATP-binding protein [Aeromicrobium choanae]